MPSTCNGVMMRAAVPVQPAAQARAHGYMFAAYCQSAAGAITRLRDSLDLA
jgi:hypothetical protein